MHANFKRVGEYLNLPPEKALMVYLMKHIDGITAYIDGHQSQREPVEGRIIDAIVYLFLLWGMLDDNKEEPNIDMDVHSFSVSSKICKCK